MKFTNLFSLLILFASSGLAQSKFPKKEVLEDLNYLRQSLEEAHYNLYAYTDKDEFSRNFEKVKSSINADSLSLLETTSLFQAVISKANNGHTEIPFPGSAYIEYAYAGGTIFPLELAFEDGKALIRKNWSTDNSTKAGEELISINQVPIAEVLEKIFPLVSAERVYFKLAKIELTSFPRLYWQAFGQQEEFEVEIKKGDVREKHQIKAINLIDDYEMKRDEVFSGTREVKFLEQAAYLKPGNFSGDEEQYRNFLDSSFQEINKKSPPNLIIDLRNNLGGDNTFSDYLVSFLADKPFQWNSEFTLKTSSILKSHVRETYDTTQAFWKSVLTHENGSIYPYEFEDFDPQPLEKRFSGQVYVLINRQTHSQSAVTAAQMQDYGWATVVGEETGDFPSLYASQYGFALPNTGIEVKISKGYIVRVNGSKKSEGVIPDIFIKDHLLDEEDEVLEGLLNKINNSN